MFTHKINKNLLEALSNFSECKGILRPKSLRTTAVVLVLDTFSPVRFLPSGARTPIRRHASKQQFRMLRVECGHGSPRSAREQDKFSPGGGRRDLRRQRTRRMSRKLPGRHGRCQRGGHISGRERAEAKAETKEWHGASRLLQREPSAHRVGTLGKREGAGWQSPGHSRPEKLMMGHQKAFNRACDRSAFKAKKLCQRC